MPKNTNYKLILASASPRRKELLSAAGYTFEIYVPKGEELNIVGKTFNENLINACTIQKAKNAFKEMFNYNYHDITTKNLDPVIIISCDTVVVNNGIIIGKPKDKKDAINILSSLSNKTHKVISSVCVYKDGNYNTMIETTEVTFRNISIEEIVAYIDRCNPLDKAGSYGIQDENFDFAINIKGNLDNVIGLPLYTLKKLLKT